MELSLRYTSEMVNYLIAGSVLQYYSVFVLELEDETMKGLINLRIYTSNVII